MMPALRDYFAAKAIIGCITAPWHPEMGVSPFDTPEELAARAYRIADAMIAERDKALKGDADL